MLIEIAVAEKNVERWFCFIMLASDSFPLIREENAEVTRKISESSGVYPSPALVATTTA